MGEIQKTKNGKKLWIVLAIAAVVLIVICAVVFLNKGGKDTYHNIKVLDAIGNVLVQRDDEEGMEAYSDMNLQSGDDVSVGDESELDLRLDDDKFVYASANTHMVVESTGDKDTSNVRISVDEGGVLHKVDKKLKNGSTYEIETPNSTMAIRGTIVSANVKTEKNGTSHAEFAFYEGKGELQLYDKDANPVGDPVAVPQGYACNVVCDGDEPQLDGDMTPVSYKDTPDWIVEKLSSFMDEGRTLYSGEDAVTDEQMEKLLGDADEQNEPKQDDTLTASTQTVGNTTAGQQVSDTPSNSNSDSKKPSANNKDNNSNKKPEKPSVNKPEKPAVEEPPAEEQEDPTTTEPEQPTPNQPPAIDQGGNGDSQGTDQGGNGETVGPNDKPTEPTNPDDDKKPDAGNGDNQGTHHGGNDHGFGGGGDSDLGGDFPGN